MSRSAARLSFPGCYSGNVLGCQQENVKTRWLSVPISRWVWLSRAESPGSQKEGTLLMGASYAHFEISSHGGNLWRRFSAFLKATKIIIKALSRGVNKIRRRAGFSVKQRKFNMLFHQPRGCGVAGNNSVKCEIRISKPTRLSPSALSLWPKGSSTDPRRKTPVSMAFMGPEDSQDVRVIDE